MIYFLVSTFFKLVAPSLLEELIDFCEQSSRGVSSAVGAYWKPQWWIQTFRYGAGGRGRGAPLDPEIGGGSKSKGVGLPGPSPGSATDPRSWLCEIPWGGGYDKILRNVGLKQMFPPLVWVWGNGCFLALHNCFKVLLDTVRMLRS